MVLLGTTAITVIFIGIYSIAQTLVPDPGREACP